MLLLSMKMYLAVLWGIFVLFSTESMSSPIPETSTINSTAEPNNTTTQLISAHVVHDKTETQSTTWLPIHKPAELNVSARAETTVPPTVETEEVFVTHSSDSSNDSTTGLVAVNTAAATASSSAPQLLRTSTAVTTAAGEAQNSHNTTILETAKPTEDPLHQQSPTTSTDMTSSSATTSAASSATATVSSPQLKSTTKPEVTSILSSTTSPADSTQTPLFIQSLSSPSASTTSKMTVNTTSDATPVTDPTSSPITIWVTSTTNTELSSTSQPVSVTRTHNSTSEPPTMSFSTDTADNATAANSTSPAGIVIPHVSKRLPIPTTKSTPATTTAPREVSKSPPAPEVQPCSSRGVVKQCLIAIASLAGLATVFMVSTIILCTKLSARRYKVKRPQQATEMMCISALLPERNYTYTRQRNPVTNGVLVIHTCGDSEEDGGDNVTLSSFLPEYDRSI